MASTAIPNIENYLDIPIEQLEERAGKIKENVKLQTSGECKLLATRIKLTIQHLNI